MIEFTPGTIRSVAMINFINHSNLKIDLSPKINFITGRNGAGKSSILVAISVGLGSTAKATGRCTSLSELIKQGNSKAVITIELHNSPLGYMEDVYGDTIRITRTLTKSGSTFQLENFEKGSQPKIKEEIEKIKSYYNIQVENPCTIMHQDVAREFIGSSSPTRKYDLFMRGVLLTSLLAKLEDINSALSKLEEQKIHKEEEKNDLYNEMMELKRVVEVVQRSGDIAQEIKNYENELSWSYYITSVNDIEKHQAKLDELIAEKDEKKKKLNEKKMELEEEKAAMNNYTEECEQIKNKMSSLKEEINKIRKELELCNTNVKSAKAQIERRKNQINTLQEQNKKKEEDLLTARNNRDKAIQETNDEKQKFVSMKEEERASLKEDLKNIEDLIRQSKNNISQLQASKDEANTTIEKLVANVSKLNSRLKSVKAISDDKNGPDYHSSKFTYKPIGPLSKYVKIKNPKWAIAAEHIIGKAMDLFITADHHDHDILRSLGAKGQIIIYDFKYPRHKIKDPEINETDDIKRLVSEIKITSEFLTNKEGKRIDAADVIFNMLVDRFQIERIWCIADPSKAKEFAFSSIVPAAITLSGEIYKKQHGYSLLIGQKTSKSTYFGVDYTNEISELEPEIKNKEKEIERLNSSVNSMNEDIKKRSIELKTQEKNRKGILQKLNKIDFDLKHYQTDQIDSDFKIENLQETIQKNEQSIAEERELIAQTEKKLEIDREKKHELKNKLNELKGNLTETPIYEMNKVGRTINSLQREINSIQESIKNIRVKLETEQKEKLALEEKSNKVLEAARKIAGELEEHFMNNGTRKSEKLVKLIENKKKEYELVQKETGIDFDKTIKSYNEVADRYKYAEQYISDLATLVELINRSLIERYKKIDALRDSITRRTKISFSNYQKKRKYVSKLKFNHEKKTINISVKQATDSDFIDVANLSGGEKSFCLVSFLLSLWDVMECPFYCVDEFDVCMDDVNRAVAPKLLIKGAEQMTDRQFIFVTPLSLEDIAQSPTVSVWEV